MAEAVATKIVTGEVRLSWLYLFEPRKDDEGNPDKYGTTILIPKSDKATLAKIKSAIEAAKVDGKAKGTWGGKVPPNLKVSLHDGDEEKDTEESPEYAGHFYMTVNSKTRPGLVDRQMNPITDRDDLYSGCFARVAVSAFPYNSNGNKGITFFLNHVQKLRDGDRLDGRSKPEDVFEALESADEGEESFI